MEYGYIRVSTAEQNEERQLIEIEKNNVRKENLFIDKQSGKNFDRPQYKKMISRLQKGDTIFVLSIDRLGRNYVEIQQQWHFITNVKKADICVIDMPLLDTRHGKDLLGTFISDLVLQILSFVSETEHRNIKERQKQGILAAKNRGVRFGRPKKKLPANFEMLCQSYEQKDMTLNEILRICDISRSTFFRYKNREKF